MNPWLNNKNWKGKKRGERERNRERDTLPLWKKSTRTKPFVLLSCSTEGWTNDEADKVAKYRHLGNKLLKLS